VITYKWHVISYKIYVFVIRNCAIFCSFSIDYWIRLQYIFYKEKKMYLNLIKNVSSFFIGSIIMLMWINTFTMNEIWRDVIGRVKRYPRRYYPQGYLKLKCHFVKNVSVHYINRYPFHDEYDVGSIIMLMRINTFTMNELFI